MANVLLVMAAYGLTGETGYLTPDTNPETNRLSIWCSYRKLLVDAHQDRTNRAGCRRCHCRA